MQGWLIISLFLFGGFAVLFALFRVFSGGRRTHVKDATGNIIIGDVHGKAEQDYRPTVAAPPPASTTKASDDKLAVASLCLGALSLTVAVFGLYLNHFAD